MLKKLTILSLLTLLIPIFFFSFIGKNEAKYAKASVEMLNNQNYIEIFYNYKYRFDKPPLTYWLIVLSYKIFGISVASTRLFFSIFAILLVLLTFLFYKKYFSELYAYRVSLTLLSILIFQFMGSIAMPDILLTFFITSSIFSYFIYLKTNKKIHLILFSVALGLAVLTKGPAAVVIFGFALILFTIKTKNIISVKDMLISSAIILVINFPWYYLIMKETGWKFFKEFILFHNIARLKGNIPHHHTEFYFYFLHGFYIFFPYYFLLYFLPKFFYDNSERYINNDIFLLSISSVIGIFTLFMIVKTKMAHYLLPLVVFLSHLLVETFLEFSNNLFNKFTVYSAYLTFILEIIFVVILIMKNAISASLILAFLILSVNFMLLKKFPPKFAYKLLYSSALCFILLVKFVVFPALDKFNVKLKIASFLNKDKTKKVLFLKNGWPNIIFYINRNYEIKILKDLEQVKNKKNIYIVAEKKDIKNYKNLKIVFETANINNKKVVVIEQ